MQVMIQNKPEQFFDTLQIIDLFEGDYVAVVKSLMRELMSHLKTNKKRMWEHLRPRKEAQLT